MKIEIGDYVIVPEQPGYRRRSTCKTGKVVEIIEGRFAKVKQGLKVNPYLLSDLKLYAKMRSTSAK